VPTLKKSHIRLPVSKGFTLTELAIVLLIVALLIGGLLVPLSAQIDMRNASDTNKSLADIKDALIGFAAVHGRLPCPAVATTPTATAGAGLEVTSGVGCANASGAGVLPWATLGVNETDAWGNRYSYRVTLEFARTVIPATSFPSCLPAPPLVPQYAAFALCSSGKMIVLSTVGGSTIAIDIPAVVISHGKNGNGAFTPQGTRLPSGSDLDEQDNQLSPAGIDMANFNFVSKTPTATYDDLVIWISPNILANRMVTAGKLP